MYFEVVEYLAAGGEVLWGRYEHLQDAQERLADVRLDPDFPLSSSLDVVERDGDMPPLVL